MKDLSLWTEFEIERAYLTIKQLTVWDLNIINKEKDILTFEEYFPSVCKMNGLEPITKEKLEQYYQKHIHRR